MHPNPPSAATEAPGFDAIYREHLGFVVAVLRGFGAREQLRELCHEVFVRVYEDLARYDPSRPLRAWLYGITRRVVLEARRGAARASRHEALSDALAVVGFDQEAVAQAREELLVVRDALARLPEERRVVFEMKHGLGMSVAEISAALGGVPEATLYSRLYAAQQAVENALARAGRRTP